MPLIGILRRFPEGRVVDVVSAAWLAGLRVVEVTLDSKHVYDLIPQIRQRAPEMTVGVGTVTHPDQVAKVVAVGAEFVVSPIVSMPVLAACAQSGVPVIPGAATPTEIHLALSSGATAVKVFPAAQLGGPDYLRAVRSPLGEPPLIPTGGVALEHVASYLDAGAIAIGVGSSLFPEHLAGGSLDHVSEHITRWVEAVTND